MARKKKYSDKDLRMVITMYHYKFPMEDISDKFGITRGHIYRLIRDGALYRRLNIKIAA